MICKPSSVNVWPMIIDVGRMDFESDEGMPDTGYCERLAPQTVDRFAKEVRSRKFTNGSDCEVVIGLYRDTCEKVLKSIPKVKLLENDYWGDEAMESLVEVLPLCLSASLVDISYSFGNISEKGVRMLLDAAKNGKLPPKMTEFEWYHNGAYKNLTSDQKNEMEKEVKQVFGSLNLKKNIITW